MANLFNKRLPRSCAWCYYGKSSEYTNEVFCTKHGVTASDDCCRKYKYDPLKRTPHIMRPADGYKPEDFEL